jgi:tetratricopeptide (TPR) repeat protein
MYRKSLLMPLFIISLMFAGSIMASAQTFIVRGKVELRGADGTLAPVVGATIDVFRVDTGSKSPPITTNKRGEYSIAGLQAGGLFILSASAPGAAPRIKNNVRSSSEGEYDFVLESGDGKRYTQEEAMAMAKSDNTGPSTSSGSDAPKELTAEQKKAQEDYAKKKAAYDTEKTKVEGANKIIQRTYKEGNDALNSKPPNFDLAITNYDEGIAADPNFIGSAPMLMNNKSEALRLRGVDRYNKYVTSKDETLKAPAKEDLTAAYETARKSYDMVTAPEALTDAQNTPTLPKSKFDALVRMSEALRLMTTTKLDTSKGEEIKKVYGDLLANDMLTADKKLPTQLIMADLMMKTFDFDSALAEYQKILNGDPSNVDALAGKGLSMIALAGEDRAKIQEALNVLQSYVDIAPEGHQYKEGAKGTIEYYKTEQKITPIKTTRPAPKKKP